MNHGRTRMRRRRRSTQAVKRKSAVRTAADIQQSTTSGGVENSPGKDGRHTKISRGWRRRVPQVPHNNQYRSYIRTAVQNRARLRRKRR